jgi:hypothetical protein
MLNPYNVRTQATKRLFLAIVNQAISDVLENGKEAKEAQRWLLSNDFDVLDRLFALTTVGSASQDSGLGRQPGKSVGLVQQAGESATAAWLAARSNAEHRHSTNSGGQGG